MSLQNGCLTYEQHEGDVPLILTIRKLFVSKGNSIPIILYVLTRILIVANCSYCSRYDIIYVITILYLELGEPSLEN